MIDHKHLMAESEGVIAHVKHRGRGEPRHIARRLTEKPQRYYDWESRHAGLMTGVADSTSVMAQVHSLRKILLTSVHVSALPRFLKQRQVHGQDRETLVKIFHAYGDFTKAVLQEHATYLRAESTSLCARYLALKLGDSNMRNWLADYYDQYDEYFAMFCEAMLADARGEDYALRPLLYEKKLMVHQRRAAVLKLADIDAATVDLGSITGQYVRPKFTQTRAKSNKAVSGRPALKGHPYLA